MKKESEREKLRSSHYNEYSIHKKDSCERCNEWGGIERDKDGWIIRKKRNRLTVHHKDRDVENNEPDNLETLCHKCHTEEHKNDINK